MVRVEVRSLSGEFLDLDHVDPKILSSDLKEIIQCQWSIPVSCQQLLLDDSELGDSSFVLPSIDSKYDGKDCSFTHLVIHLDLVVSLSKLRSTLELGTFEERKVALEGLLCMTSGFIAKDELVQLLVINLNWRSSTLKCLALQCVCHMLEAADDMESMIFQLELAWKQDKSRKVRKEIVSTVSKIASIDCMISWFNLADLSCEDVCLVVLALQRAIVKGDHRAIGRVISVLESECPNTCKAGIQVLKRIATKGDQHVVSALIAKVGRSTSEELQCEVFSALEQLSEKNDELVLSSLFDAFKRLDFRKPSKKACMRAICTVAKRGNPRAIDCLLEWFDQNIDQDEPRKLVVWLIQLFSEIGHMSSDDEYRLLKCSQAFDLDGFVRDKFAAHHRRAKGKMSEPRDSDACLVSFSDSSKREFAALL